MWPNLVKRVGEEIVCCTISKPTSGSGISSSFGLDPCFLGRMTSDVVTVSIDKYAPRGIFLKYELKRLPREITAYFLKEILI
jgi:hypothetical protein